MPREIPEPRTRHRECFVDEVLGSIYTIPMARLLATSSAGQRLLARLRTIGPFLEGSLTISTKRCGRPTCRCATEGPLHETALLTWKEQQKTCTLHIPIALREEVAAWVAECQRLKALIHTMSAAQRAFLIAQRRRAR